MIISQEIQLITIHKRTLQDKILQALVSMFQTVCSDPLRHRIVAALCIALQRHLFLLSRTLSSLAKQAVFMELFTSPIAVVKVFCMLYVVIIVVQQIVTIISLVA
jgi:hypothetical protein